MAENMTVRPAVTVLNREQKQQIHTHSLEILARVGLRVDSERARLVFQKALGSGRVREGRVYIPRELVEQALKTVPPVVEVYDRRGNLAFRLGDDRTRFGLGVTNLYYQDAETDEAAQFTRKHMETSVRLANSLRHIDAVSTIGIIQDYDPSQADLYSVLEMVANTTKPLVVLVSAEELFPAVLDLLETLHEDLAARPFAIPYFNPVTPLILNKGTGDKMLDAIERGLPLIYSNFSMVGMSTPVTPAGTLALLNAELLGGLVLSQLAKEGAPLILGSLPYFFDMRAMIDINDPLSQLLNLACAEMMQHYHIPHAGTSGSGPGLGPDFIASSTYMMNHLSSLIGKSGLAPFTGSAMGSKAFSPVCAVQADEMIAQALIFAQGFSLDDDSFAMDDIEQVGPGGSFVNTRRTRKLFRKAYYSSDLMPALSLEKWQIQGCPKTIDILREKTRHHLATPVVPEDYKELIGRGEEFIKNRYKRK